MNPMKSIHREYDEQNQKWNIIAYYVTGSRKHLCSNITTERSSRKMFTQFVNKYGFRKFGEGVARRQAQ